MEITKESLNHMALFTHVSSDTLEAILSKALLKQCVRGEHLFRDKEEIHTIYMVLKGKVSLYKINENGQKKVIFILGEGQLINEVILQELPASINCEVFEEAHILCLDKQDFLGFMEKDFELSKAVIFSLSIKVRRMYRQLKNATGVLNIEKRVAAKLWKLGKDYGKAAPEGVYINMDMSITYLADLLGSSRETVSRALKILSNKGLIAYHNKKIVIRDSKALALFFKTS